ncbi:hypothetical protein B0T25DRAFT_237952 [Lasiosphaeria hispida]|uniref:Uncharacterized protein n=1 Tax=Lasiosphaeria hispida TaxID=260671 RepID=A0AAJ0HE88_9PEZI|nr:hypothetical protein B0T25DRAFT_237952 [Lasiosphaeria hispida]
MLNPSSYAGFSTAGGYEGIDWSRLHNAIDSGSGILFLSGEDRAIAESLNLHPDLLGFLNEQRDWNPTTLGVSENMDTKQQLLLTAYRDMEATGFVYPKLNFDPTAAVHRQGRFVDKLHRYGWLQSPTVVPLLRGAIDRYIQFFTLVSQARGGVVPTADVDLVWHTHQLSPRRYAAFCKARAGRFVNHEDSDAPERIAQVADGFERAQEAYREVFAGDYQICLSWYCVAARLNSSGKPGLADADRAVLDSWMATEQKRRADAHVEEMAFAKCPCLAAGWKAIRGAGYEPPVGWKSAESLDCANPPPCAPPPCDDSEDPARWERAENLQCAEPPPCSPPPPCEDSEVTVGWKRAEDLQCAEPPPCSPPPPCDGSESPTGWKGVEGHHREGDVVRCFLEL